MIPVNEPSIGREELARVTACVKSNWISSQGKFLKELEDEFARYCGVRFGISTTNGTAALHLALAALSIGPGDEVLVPTFTMAATAFAVCYCGARPVFIDAEPETFSLDVNRVADYLRRQEKKGTLRVKAVIPVHLYGHPMDLDPLLELARRYSLAVVEDAAEAHGAEYKGKKCGGLGDLGCFSFYANKIITTGEGGMVVTDNPRLADRARSLKDLAHDPGKRFRHIELGFNYRMTNLQAAVGIAQLKKIDRHIQQKRWMAGEYTRRLESLPGLTLPQEKSWAKNVYWMYGLLVEPEFGLTRDQLMAYLKEKGVDTRSFFIPMHLQPVFTQGRYKAKRNGPFPVAEEIAQKGLYLPSGLTLTESQIQYVCRQMKKASLAGRGQIEAELSRR
ncbi:MAG: DegT/DnrJ/EryC1/StrS family aminotransferase [Deltaproteobacteria bacterium]|nr:DegT/DnrJ/EryC1/StrS family aminotransferase [Deltaproteobacteria bacterium]